MTERILDDGLTDHNMQQISLEADMVKDGDKRGKIYGIRSNRHISDNVWGN